METAVLQIGKRSLPLNAGVYLIRGGTTKTSTELEHHSLLIENESVDDKHAMIVVEDSSIFIYDLASRFGTFVNGERLPVLTKYFVPEDVRIRFGTVDGQLKKFSTLEQHHSSGFHEESLHLVLDQSNQTSDAENLTIPETQYLLPNKDDGNANISSNEDNSNNTSNNTSIPETQEVLQETRFLCASNTSKQLEITKEQLSKSPDDQDLGSQFYLCTQEFNEALQDGTSESNSRDLLENMHWLVDANAEPSTAIKQIINSNQIAGNENLSKSDSEIVTEDDENMRTVTPDLFNVELLEEFEKGENGIKNAKAKRAPKENVTAEEISTISIKDVYSEERTQTASEKSITHDQPDFLEKTNSTSSGTIPSPPIVTDNYNPVDLQTRSTTTGTIKQLDQIELDLFEGEVMGNGPQNGIFSGSPLEHSNKENMLLGDLEPTQVFVSKKAMKPPVAALPSSSLSTEQPSLESDLEPNQVFVSKKAMKPPIAALPSSSSLTKQPSLESDLEPTQVFVSKKAMKPPVAALPSSSSSKKQPSLESDLEPTQVFVSKKAMKPPVAALPSSSSSKKQPSLESGLEPTQIYVSNKTKDTGTLKLSVPNKTTLPGDEKDLEPTQQFVPKNFSKNTIKLDPNSDVKSMYLNSTPKRQSKPTNCNFRSFFADVESALIQDDKSSNSKATHKRLSTAVATAYDNRTPEVISKAFARIKPTDLASRCIYTNSDNEDALSRLENYGKVQTDFESLMSFIKQQEDKKSFDYLKEPDELLGKYFEPKKNKKPKAQMVEKNSVQNAENSSSSHSLKSKQSACDVVEKTNESSKSENQNQRKKRAATVNDVAADVSTNKKTTKTESFDGRKENPGMKRCSPDNEAAGNIPSNKTTTDNDSSGVKKISRGVKQGATENEAAVDISPKKKTEAESSDGKNGNAGKKRSAPENKAAADISTKKKRETDSSGGKKGNSGMKRSAPENEDDGNISSNKTTTDNDSSGVKKISRGKTYSATENEGAADISTKKKTETDSSDGKNGNAGKKRSALENEYDGIISSNKKKKDTDSSNKKAADTDSSSFRRGNRGMKRSAASNDAHTDIPKKKIAVETNSIGGKKERTTRDTQPVLKVEEESEVNTRTTKRTRNNSNSSSVTVTNSTSSSRSARSNSTKTKEPKRGAKSQSVRTETLSSTSDGVTIDLPDTNKSTKKIRTRKQSHLAQNHNVQITDTTLQFDHNSSIIEVEGRRTRLQASNSMLAAIQESSMSQNSGLAEPDELDEMPSTSRMARVRANSERKIEQKKVLKLAFTMVEPEKRMELLKNANNKWIEVEDPCDCEILVMDRGNRTRKFLIAIAKGIPIVTSKWVEAIKDTGVISVRPNFFFKDVKFEKTFKFSLLNTLNEAKKAKLFTDFLFLFTKNLTPNPIEMKSIVSCAGGTVLEHIDKIPKEGENKKSVQRLYLISSQKDCQHWHSYRRKNSNICITSTEAVMLAVMRYDSEILKKKSLS